MPPNKSRSWAARFGLLIIALNSVRLGCAPNSAVVREALQALAKGKRRSVTALAGGLVGSIEGPVDLATNKKHMAGYGK